MWVPYCSTVSILCLRKSRCTVLAADSTFDAQLPPGIFDKRLKFSYG